MDHLKLHYLTQLMQEQIDTQAEIKERSSALSEGDLTLDEALTQRKIIDLDEEYLEHIAKELLSHADQAFLGYTHPGGLTTLFYGYSTPPPSAYSPGHYTRDPR
jgi:hypothetical protein